MSTCPTDIDSCPRVDEHDQRRKWHVNRGISVDTWIALAVLVFAAVGFYMTQESRQTRTETRIVTLEATDVRIEKTIGDQRGELVNKVDRIEEKLDRLIERGGK